METDDTNFDDALAKAFEGKSFLRRKDLITYLIENNKDKAGFSEPSIARKLRRLTKDNEYSIIKGSELEKYGINDEDKNAAYIMPKSSTEIKEYLDEIFELLKTGDDIDKETVLKDLESYQLKYPLDGKQLDVLASNLNSKDDSLVDNLLRIIYNYILRYNREPTNPDKLIKQLKLLLKRYPRKVDKHTNLRTHIIMLLGHYNQQEVVERFIQDIKEISNLQDIENDYIHRPTAEIIETNRKKLFDLERMLKKEAEKEPVGTAHFDKAEKARFIGRIRHTAMEHLGIAKSSFFGHDEIEQAMRKK